MELKDKYQERERGRVRVREQNKKDEGVAVGVKSCNSSLWEVSMRAEKMIQLHSILDFTVVERLAALAVYGS